MQQRAATGAAVIVLARAAYSHDELAVCRVEAVAAPLSAFEAGKQPARDAVCVRTGETILFVVCRRPSSLRQVAQKKTCSEILALGFLEKKQLPLPFSELGRFRNGLRGSELLRNNVGPEGDPRRSMPTSIFPKIDTEIAGQDQAGRQAVGPSLPPCKSQQLLRLSAAGRQHDVVQQGYKARGQVGEALECQRPIAGAR